MKTRHANLISTCCGKQREALKPSFQRHKTTGNRGSDSTTPGKNHLPQQKLVILVMALCWLSTSTCMGWEGDPLKLKRLPWFWKTGYTPLQLYTSSDLVGQAQLDAIEKVPEEQQAEDYSFVFTLAFTNVLKGKAGRYQVYGFREFQDPSLLDLSTFSETPTKEEVSRLSGARWNWMPGKSYNLICATNYYAKRMELHSVVTQEWSQYVQVLREGAKRYRQHREEENTRRAAVSKRWDKSREDMELGDISSEEYERLSDGYRKENRAISDEYDENSMITYPDGREGIYEQIDWGFLSQEIEAP